jgi:FkbM family methyltransferase
LNQETITIQETKEFSIREKHKQSSRKLKDEIIERTPSNLFKYFANLYYRLAFNKERVAIEKYRDWWLVTKGGISLLSPTPKFIGLSTLKEFEGKFEKFFKIEKDDTVVDVGACIGDTTVPMAIKTGEKGTVIAIEPEPRNIRFLRANTSCFNNVCIIQKAAWNRKETIRFNLHTSCTGHSIIDQSKNYMEVQADTLDNIVKDWDRIDSCKIDVQGAELEVLEGAEEMLRKTKNIAVETHYSGEKALYPKVAAFLKTRNFSVRVTPDRVVHAWIR